MTTHFMKWIKLVAIFEVKHLTNCLRGIHNAWYLYYVLRLMIKVICGGMGMALLTTQLGVRLLVKYG
ncbi:hypothetical protein SHAQ108633_00105 [Shewanella aquimarina]